MQLVGGHVDNVSPLFLIDCSYNSNFILNLLLFRTWEYFSLSLYTTEYFF